MTDRLGRRRSPANTPGVRRGCAPLNKGLKFPPEVLTPREIDGLLAACGRGRAGVRNRALIVVLWRTGLRCEEGCSLQLRDVDPREATITVRHGKGNRHRVVGMDEQAFAVLARWLEVRRGLSLPAGAPLFCTFSSGSVGQPLSGSYVRELCKRLARRAGVEKRVHPHGLRHTMAAELAREGVPVKLIQEQLGHSSLAMTDRYISHLHPGEVIQRMKARHWPLPS